MLLIWYGVCKWGPIASCYVCVCLCSSRLFGALFRCLTIKTHDNKLFVVIYTDWTCIIGYENGCRWQIHWQYELHYIRTRIRKVRERRDNERKTKRKKTQQKWIDVRARTEGKTTYRRLQNCIYFDFAWEHRGYTSCVYFVRCRFISCVFSHSLQLFICIQISETSTRKSHAHRFAVNSPTFPQHWVNWLCCDFSRYWLFVVDSICCWCQQQNCLVCCTLFVVCVCALTTEFSVNKFSGLDSGIKNCPTQVVIITCNNKDDNNREHGLNMIDENQNTIRHSIIRMHFFCLSDRNTKNVSYTMQATHNFM